MTFAQLRAIKRELAKRQAVLDALERLSFKAIAERAGTTEAVVRAVEVGRR